MVANRRGFMEVDIMKVVKRFPGSLRAQVEALAGMARKDHPNLRLGQSLFNALNDINPTLANGVRSKELDPFYNDDRALSFLAWLDSVVTTP